MWRLAHGTKGLIYAIGVIGTLLVYGLWQERIMSQAYGEEEVYFAWSVYLVFWNRIFGIVFAVAMVVATGENLKARAPIWRYMVVSVATVAGSVCQYEALKYVSFTVQILGKSCKMLPVILWGQCIFRRKYRVVDWIVSVFVTIGVIWFLLSGSIQPTHSHGSSAYGILLLLAFILIDSFTSTFQERLFAEHRTSKYNQMLYINAAASILSIFILSVSGNVHHAFGMCIRHHDLWGDISILSGAAVVAQWFIYSQVQEFGALAFATTMNVRQIVSVVFSYIVYDHIITKAQIAGLAIVGAALLFQNLTGCLAAESATEKAPLVNKEVNKEDPEEGTETATSSAISILKKSSISQCCFPFRTRS